jgi:ubiquinone/menaquinone biosynthesis C-methylase UbiE
VVTDNRVYDKYSNPYDRILLNWEPYLDLRQAHLSSIEGGLILDFGTGTGNQAIELARQGKRVVAIDINGRMLACLSRKNPFTGSIYAAIMDVQETGFKDGTFDSVTSMNVLYNVPDPIKAMKEAFRVMKAHGVLSLSGPLRHADNNEIYVHIRDAMVQKGMYDDATRSSIDVMLAANESLVKNATFFDCAGLSRILTQVGFKEIMNPSEDHYLGNAYFLAARK